MHRYDVYAVVMISVLAGIVSKSIAGWVLPIEYANLDFLFTCGAITIIILVIRKFESPTRKTISL